MKLVAKEEKVQDNNWKREIDLSAPQQIGDNDCGVFTMMYAKYLTLGKEFTFGQCDMKKFRLAIGLENYHYLRKEEEKKKRKWSDVL